jgi:hypothetical protein
MLLSGTSAGATAGAVDPWTLLPLLQPSAVVGSINVSTSIKPFFRPGSPAEGRSTTRPPSSAQGLRAFPAQNPTIEVVYNASEGLGTIPDRMISAPFPYSMESGTRPTTGPIPGPFPDPELSPDGLAKLPSLPEVRDVQMSGNLIPPQSWMTLKVPVGPMTQSFRVTVAPGSRELPNDIPALDQLDLVGPTGEVLAELKGISSGWQGTSQDLRIWLSGVPNGAVLVLRIVDNHVVTTPTESTDADLPASVPFQMELQRSEMAGPIAGFPNGESIAPLTVTSSLSIAAGSTAGSTSGSVALSMIRLYSEDVSSSLTLAVSGEGQAPPATAARVPSEMDDPAPGVGVGPLASRRSSPIGPPLGTSSGELTPSSDRQEQAFDLSTDTPVVALDPDQWPDDDTDSVEPAPLPEIPWRGAVVREDGSRIVTLRGTGGFPVLVCSLSGTRTSPDPAELLATLPSNLVPGQNANNVAALLADARERPEERHRADDPTISDFASAAFGLLLGASLATGPFYPDLIAMIRPYVTRPLHVRSRLRVTAESSRNSIRRLRSWLSLAPQR